MPPQYSALIFDLDGTLVDSYGPIAQSLNHVRQTFGFAPKSLEDVRAEVGHGLDQLIRENVGEARKDEGVALFRARYRRVFRDGTRLLPGVEKVLSVFRDRNIPMAVTSNKPAYFSREILEGLGLGGVFVAVLGPEMVERPKPDPEMVLLAIELLAREKGEILYVGDMTIDIETCRRTGIDVCVIPGGSDPRERLVEAKPDFLIDRFEELLPLVSSSTNA